MESIREKVAYILTHEFGNKEQGHIFRPEDTIKRTGAGKKHTKHELRTSTSWTAQSFPNTSILVSCIGITMAEFIKNYENNQLLFFKSGETGFVQISIYLNKPIWKTRGFVKTIDRDSGLIELHIGDVFHPIIVKISKATPKWLYSEEQPMAFLCKIHQAWRQLSPQIIQDMDWSDVWKTFKPDGHYYAEERW